MRWTDWQKTRRANGHVCGLSPRQILSISSNLTIGLHSNPVLAPGGSVTVSMSADHFESIVGTIIGACDYNTILSPGTSSSFSSKRDISAAS